MWNQISCKSQYSEFLKKRQDRNLKRSLSNMRSRIDNKPPKQLSHVAKNAKGKLKIKERNQEIEKQNQILLTKMLKIERNPSNLHPAQLKAPKTPQFGTSRYKELERIAKENYRMFKRLENTTPTYSTAKLNEENKYHDYLLQNMRMNSGKLKNRPDTETSQLFSRVSRRRERDTAQDIMSTTS